MAVSGLWLGFEHEGSGACTGNQLSYAQHIKDYCFNELDLCTSAASNARVLLYGRAVENTATTTTERQTSETGGMCRNMEGGLHLQIAAAGVHVVAMNYAVLVAAFVHACLRVS